MVCSELIFELPLPVKCRMKVTAQVLRRTLLTRSALPAECTALAMPNPEYGCSYGKTAEKFINKRQHPVCHTQAYLNFS